MPEICIRRAQFIQPLSAYSRRSFSFNLAQGQKTTFAMEIFYQA